MHAAAALYGSVLEYDARSMLGWPNADLSMWQRPLKAFDSKKKV